VTGAVVDHLVVAAASLADGVAWCERTLGVTPGPGGRHLLFGTHNRLLKIESEAFALAYLEIIAIDPDASAPGRARWFGLDTLDLAGGPRLLHLVARTDALAALQQGLLDIGLDPGPAIAASRDTPEGRLAWQILVRDDGRLPAEGALPTLIAWQGRHPAAEMPASGVVLKSLTLGGVPPAAAALLALPGVALSSARSPALQGVFGTPRGDVTLTSA
jgi:hypothetical protein